MIDIAVIGAGPAGLSAAVNAKILGKEICVYCNYESYLNKAENVDNFLGFHGINGKELMDIFLSHTKKLSIEPVRSKISNIVPLADRFLLNVDSNIIEARAVILALGVTPSNEIKGEKEFLGKGVSYCAVCDGMIYRNKKAVVYGLEDNAAHEANYLKNIGVDVTFISNKNLKIGLDEGIEYIEGKVLEIVGEKKLTKVKINDKLINTDALFILRKSIAPSTMLDGLEINGGYIRVDNNMCTNIKGVFAAGDCVGRPLQISKAVGEGLIAATSAANYIENILGGKIIE